MRYKSNPWLSTASFEHFHTEPFQPIPDRITGFQK